MGRTTDNTQLWQEEAIQWWTVLHGEGVTVADRREFLSWVSRSPERIEAYLGVARLMSALQSDGVRWPDTPVEELIREAKASREGVSSAPVVSLRSSAQRMPARASAAADRRGLRGLFGWKLGIGAAVTAVLVLVCWLLLPAAPQFYQTRPGEQRSVLLADGSRVTLDSDSDVAVQLGKHRRIVRLLRGEALFQVSHDPARPFDVYAGGTVVRAIGTEFNVDMQTTYTSVTVLQGRVAVMSESQANQPVGGASSPAADAGRMSRPVLKKFPAPPGTLILGVAQRVLITPAGMGAPQRVSDLAATTAWTRRQLVFEQRPLEEVVNELNHYSGRRIVIESARLRQRKVTGVIELDDPGSFLSFLSDVPGVVVRKASDGASIVTLDARAPGEPRRAGAASPP